MAKEFHQKKSLSEFDDRELMLLILANQVKIFRQTKYLMQAIKNTEGEHLGFYSQTFKELVQDADDILNQADEHLDQEDEDKGFLKF